MWPCICRAPQPAAVARHLTIEVCHDLAVYIGVGGGHLAVYIGVRGSQSAVVASSIHDRHHVTGQGVPELFGHVVPEGVVILFTLAFPQGKAKVLILPRSFIHSFIQ